MFARGSRLGERGRVATEIAAIRASALRGPAGFVVGQLWGFLWVPRIKMTANSEQSCSQRKLKACSEELDNEQVRALTSNPAQTCFFSC